MQTINIFHYTQLYNKKAIIWPMYRETILFYKVNIMRLCKKCKQNSACPDGVLCRICREHRPRPITNRRDTCRICGKQLTLTGKTDGVLCPTCRNKSE